MDKSNYQPGTFGYRTEAWQKRYFELLTTPDADFTDVNAEAAQLLIETLPMLDRAMESLIQATSLVVKLRRR